MAVTNVLELLVWLQEQKKLLNKHVIELSVKNMEINSMSLKCQLIKTPAMNTKLQSLKLQQVKIQELMLVIGGKREMISQISDIIGCSLEDGAVKKYCEQMETQERGNKCV